jgi:hypothetical protein
VSKFVFAILAIFPCLAWASPFLVSDPWPTTGSMPTSCLYQEGTTTAVETAVVVNAQGAPFCKFDLASVTRASHTFSVWARNAWGDSNHVPFAFSATVPADPTGWRITP